MEGGRAGGSEGGWEGGTERGREGAREGGREWEQDREKYNVLLTQIIDKREPTLNLFRQLIPHTCWTTDLENLPSVESEVMCGQIAMVT